MSNSQNFYLGDNANNIYKNSTSNCEQIIIYSGINVAGYLMAELGLGEAARSYIAALSHLNLCTALTDFSIGTSSRKKDDTLKDFSFNNPYSTNLICINADQVTDFINHIGTQYFKDKYNIGVWAWELPNFPSKWWSYFNYFDEIWVGSTFMYQSIVKHSPIPVVTIPYVVQINIKRKYSKTDFDLPVNEFVFLFIFDFLSIFERKNPLAVVEAFKKAFHYSEPVRLVIKCINGEHDFKNFYILQEAIADHRITLIDKYLLKDDKNGLLSVCDCYISLHRSEGFGLTLAEAMFLEKPVIATGWSGNMDFMSINNSYLVEYNLTEILEDYGPYKQGEIWAEPSITDAAQIMLEIYEQPKEAEKKAKRAAADIRAMNSPEVIANLIKTRLDIIYDLQQSSRIEQIQSLSAKQIKQMQDRITAIESSKFWKLRKRWFVIKRLIGLRYKLAKNKSRSHFLPIYIFVNKVIRGIKFK